jgi:23S rRNA (cytidine2498-2'-O)-methyltransferase
LGPTSPRPRKKVFGKTPARVPGERRITPDDDWDTGPDMGDEDTHRPLNGAMNRTANRAMNQATHTTPPRTPAAQPRVGEWLWTCRVGAENDVSEELAQHKVASRTLQPGLLASARRPTVRRDGKPTDVALTFARQGLPIDALTAPEPGAIADAVVKQLRRPAALHVFSPDSDAGNLLAGQASGLQQALAASLSGRGVELLTDGPAALAADGQLVQVCLLEAGHAAVGVLMARAAQSLYPGGRLRVGVRGAAPARSARKLAEALILMGHGPEPSEVCVDLGAAPGGWSQVLLERRCHVVAVDPGGLAPDIARRVEHLRMNAFSFAPDIPADWVLCDMAYRPLEVAALLAKWGRRHWARFLVANFKLPMKRRVEMIGRLREILETGGWTDLRFRQLYHDREEVTVWGWRGFGTGTRAPRCPTAPPREQPAAERYADRDASDGFERGPRERKGPPAGRRPPARSTPQRPTPQRSKAAGPRPPERPSRPGRSGPERRPGQPARPGRPKRSGPSGRTRR